MRASTPSPLSVQILSPAHAHARAHSFKLQRSSGSADGCELLCRGHASLSGEQDTDGPACIPRATSESPLTRGLQCADDFAQGWVDFFDFFFSLHPHILLFVLIVVIVDDPASKPRVLSYHYRKRFCQLSSKSVPFPIILANSRPNGSNYTGVLPPEATVFEFSPLELASYDPSLSAAIDLKFAGSNLTDGKPVNDQACLEGLDETGFVMGTSSSLFNQILDSDREELMDSEYFKVVTHLLARLLEDVRTRDDDVANWPNSFRNVAPSTFADTNSDWLELIDGGSNGEVVPFSPLLVKARGLDVIVGVDSSADDDNNWPSGDAPLFTANRTLKFLNDTHQQFPPIPSTSQEFVDAGANQRPTFFGCDPQQSPPEYPLVIYLPNSPPLTGDNPVTNTDTFKLSYTQKHSQLFIDQVFSNTIGGFVPNSNSPDSNFGECVQCAAIDRARLKSTPSVPRSDLCSKCFQQYCFDPTNPPTQSELPNRKYVFVDPDSQSYFQRHKAAIIGGVVGGVVALIIIIAGLVYLCRRKKLSRRAAQYDTLAKSASRTSDLQE
ncbi:uncharacterized protein ARMOST_15668 [Armillaria ostoyae]|uniref:Lysophospholipase n=1 Tax=Armillaria ostoyae TaxID=47428 RepID=A0A284RU53_ARMOS|nr:uncharacterized protein ARMOST_15668 [Armillaria ostoyae]